MHLRILLLLILNLRDTNVLFESFGSWWFWIPRYILDLFLCIVFFRLFSTLLFAFKLHIKNQRGRHTWVFGILVPSVCMTIGHYWKSLGGKFLLQFTKFWNSKLWILCNFSNNYLIIIGKNLFEMFFNYFLLQKFSLNEALKIRVHLIHEEVPCTKKHDIFSSFSNVVGSLLLG